MFKKGKVEGYLWNLYLKDENTCIHISSNIDSNTDMLQFYFIKKNPDCETCSTSMFSFKAKEMLWLVVVIIYSILTNSLSSSIFRQGASCCVCLCYWCETHSKLEWIIELCDLKILEMFLFHLTNLPVTFLAYCCLIIWSSISQWVLLTQLSE